MWTKASLYNLSDNKMQLFPLYSLCLSSYFNGRELEVFHNRKLNANVWSNIFSNY